MANEVCIVQPDVGVVSETFIRGHAERLPASVIVLHGYPPQIDRRPFCKPSVLTRTIRKCRRTFLQSSVEHDRDADLLSVFSSDQAACRRLRSALRRVFRCARQSEAGASSRRACSRLRREPPRPSRNAQI
jgi:hypothetical protein